MTARNQAKARRAAPSICDDPAIPLIRRIVGLRMAYAVVDRNVWTDELRRNPNANFFRSRNVVYVHRWRKAPPSPWRNGSQEHLPITRDGLKAKLEALRLEVGQCKRSIFTRAAQSLFTMFYTDQSYLLTHAGTASAVSRIREALPYLPDETRAFLRGFDESANRDGQMTVDHALARGGMAP